jgi:hypothetical protein
LARIRTIKPEFFRHHELYLAEIEDKMPLRVAFAGLWTAADREGRFRWIPEELKLDCLPYDKIEFQRVLIALTTRGFIEKYTVNGHDYGWIPGFPRHQVINNKERPSHLPSIEESDTLTRDERVSDASLTRINLDQGEGKGKEQGKEGNKDICQLIADEWNATRGVKQIRKIDHSRTQKLKSRLNDWQWDWKSALKKFPLQCFSNGNGWLPNFDWFLRPETVNSILEGKYDFTPSNGDKKNGTHQLSLTGNETPGSTIEQRTSRGEKLYVPKQ